MIFIPFQSSALKTIHEVSHPFSFPSCLKGTHIYPPSTYRKHLIRDSDAPWFMFYVYGFDLLGKIWLVSIVVALVVAYLFGCVVSTILTQPRCQET